MKGSVLLFTIFLVASCGDEPSIDLAIPEDPFDAQIVREMNRENIPGVSAAIIKDDSIVWSQSYGYADIESKTPTSDETIYVLASISKTFRAVAVLQLFEEGRVNLDADVNDYLPFDLRNPNYPEDSITIRMLLGHHSSISSPLETVAPDFYDYFVAPESPDLQDHLESYLLANGENYRPDIWLEDRPGTQFQYSTLGSRVISLVVQEVSELEVSNFMQERIFTPLEMTRSSFGLGEDQQEFLSTLYNTNLETYPHYDFPLMVRSSTKELANYVIMLMDAGSFNDQTILNDSIATEMLNLDYTQSDRLRNIWWDHQDRWIGHTGGYRGAACSIDFNLTTKVGTIILSNAQQSSVGPGGAIHTLIRSKALSL